MRRRLFTLISAVSLLLCMATVALWVRSRCHREGYCVAHASWGLVAYVSGGQACLQWMRVPPGDGSFCWNMDLQGRTDPISIAEPNPAGAARYVWLMPAAAAEENHTATPPRPVEWRGFAFLDSSWSTGEFEEPPLAFVLEGQRSSALMKYTGVGLPLWPVALATAVIPAAWFAAMFRRRVYCAPGQCAQCGYDLRATPERCPECGAIRTVGK